MSCRTSFGGFFDADSVVSIDRLRDEAGWIDFQSKENTLLANVNEAISYISDLIGRPLLSEDWEYYFNRPRDIYGEIDPDGIICLTVSDFRELKYIKYFSDNRQSSTGHFEPDGTIDLANIDTDYTSGILRLYCRLEDGWPVTDEMNHEYALRVGIRRHVDFSNYRNLIIKNSAFHYALGLCRGEMMDRLVDNVKFELADGFYSNGRPRIRVPARDNRIISKKVG